MQHLIKLTGILLAMTTTALSKQRSAIGARHDLVEVSVIFYEEAHELGASFSPYDLVQGVCNTLPCCWLDRAESVVISPGYTCIFFGLPGCEGPPTTLSGTVDVLPKTLYNNVKSLFCSKD